MLLIYRLTKPELDRCREECNFTPDEAAYFEARSKQKSHIEISMENNWCERKTSDIASHTKEKIQKILRI